MSWDAFQREALAELGLQPQRLVDPIADIADPTVAAAASSRTPGAGASPAWLTALARAAGCVPEALPALLPGLQAPDGPAARRALWPRLRRLRAAHRRGP